MHALDKMCFTYDHHVQLQNQNQGNANILQTIFRGISHFCESGLGMKLELIQPLLDTCVLYTHLQATLKTMLARPFTLWRGPLKD